MTCEYFGPRQLDYLPCRYGTSRTLFRGPKANLDAPHILFLGGTETYGKFLKTPYPARVADLLGLPAVNLGVANAGPDVYLADKSLTAMSHRAAATIVQVTGAQNLTNRYYSVHPRRNDRFVQASRLLQTVFRDVDFSEFHFTRHLVTHLHSLSPDRFAVLLVELRQAWVARMTALMKTLSGPVILLWFAKHDCRTEPDDLASFRDPLFVTHDMVEALRPLVQDIVYAPVSDEALAEGTRDMRFSAIEAPAAERLINARGHADTAMGMIPALARALAQPAELDG